MRLSGKTDKQRYLNLYFQIHQPRRLRNFHFLDIGNGEDNFDDKLNKKIIQKIATQSYLPANHLLLKLIRLYPELRITFSVSGLALEQIERYCPDVLESFRMLAASGSVEFLAETYYHSLCFLIDHNEFIYQVDKHSESVERLLGVRPTVFRNTELIYSDQLGNVISKLGFKGVYLDGTEKILNWKSSGKLYEHPDGNGLKLFFRNYQMSDDIAFRFSDKTWKEYPLTASKYVGWLENSSQENLINLGMDYETFGEHHKADTGILKFLEDFLTGIAKQKKIKMLNPSEAIQLLTTTDSVSVPTPVSWADTERDLSAWLGNEMQRDAFDSMNKLKNDLFMSNDLALIERWRYLQTSDHFYYMSTKNADDGNVHHYFSHYSSPHEAFINYMNVLSDLEFSISEKVKKSSDKSSPIRAMTNVSVLSDKHHC